MSTKQSSHSEQLVDNSQVNTPSTHSGTRLSLNATIIAAAALLASIAVGALLLFGLSPDQENLADHPLSQNVEITGIAGMTIILLVCGVILVAILRAFQRHKLSVKENGSRTNDGESPALEPENRTDQPQPLADGRARRFLRLNRSTERLVSVERDLIRKISENYAIDRGTYRLMTEVQICTNRILSQLQDLQSLSADDGETVSDVKLDDVTVG